MKKGVVRFHVLRLIYGGLDWNRTSGTRIFNTRVRQKASIYAGYKRLTCNVAHTVLQQNHRNCGTFLLYHKHKYLQVEGHRLKITTPKAFAVC